MNLNEIGEAGLIERIKKRVSKPSPDVNMSKDKLACPEDENIIAGIGDDAAVIKSDGENYTLLTTDMLIENVHFTLPAMSFPQIGHKALAVNLSDIAAMGGVPKFCLVSLGLNKKIKVEDVDEIYKGLLPLAEEYNVKVLGGDTNSSPSELVIDICVIGEVEPDSLCLRSGARAGDSIFVTGTLGGAAVYLAKGKYLPVTPRIKTARVITKTVKVHAMIDISDGLANDLHNIVRSSKVGALINIEDIPVFPEAGKELAISGGEDFELLFTAPDAEKDKLLREIPEKTGTALTCIGKIVEEGVKIKAEDGKISLLPPGGYKHFK
jgi:thiamine-monophosphate kinase